METALDVSEGDVRLRLLRCERLIEGSGWGWGEVRETKVDSRVSDRAILWQWKRIGVWRSW